MLVPQGSVQFVSNVVFARFVLGEEITLRVILATAVILGGQVSQPISLTRFYLCICAYTDDVDWCIYVQVLIVIFSSHASHNYDAHSLMALYNTTFLVRSSSSTFPTFSALSRPSNPRFCLFSFIPVLLPLH